MNGDLLRLVDSIAREKNIDRDTVFSGIENALLSAARKHYGADCQVEATVNRVDGKMSVSVDDVPVEQRALGRIAAQTAKQVMIQKNREAERNSIYEEFAGRKGSIVSGQVVRIEGGNLIVNLGRTEGFLPRSEQIPGEAVHEADRIRALILDVRESGSQVKIVLSRTNAELIRRLFELEVPEVSDRIIEIRGIAREPGQRTKIAVSSIDTRVDAVGACVGVRGSRIKNIVEELGGEKIDIVRFNESSQVFIANALRPAEVEDIFLNQHIGRATVIVPEDQLSLAIGKRGQNVRLGARLTGWDLDIMMADEFAQQRDNAVAVLAEVPGMTPELAERIASAGFVSLSDLVEIDPEILTSFEDVDEGLAESIVGFAGEYVRQLEAARAEEAKRAKAEAEAAASQEQPGEAGATEAGTAESGEAEAPSGEAESDAETAPAEEAETEAADTKAADEESEGEETDSEAGEPAGPGDEDGEVDRDRAAAPSGEAGETPEGPSPESNEGEAPAEKPLAGPEGEPPA